MPKPRYWGVEPNRNRHGRLRWYFRADRTKPRIRLPDEYGSPAFELAYRAAVAGDPMPTSQSLPRHGRRASRGSLGWLVSLYLASPAFLDNRASTQRPRRTMLEKLAISKGRVDVEDITRAVIQESMNARRETVHMANAWLGVVSGMFEWATEERLDPETGGSFRLEANPCEHIKRFKAPRKDDLDEEEDGHPTWSDEDLDAFEAAYCHGTRQRLIYEVFLCTGLRVGDAARAGRQHVKDGVLRLKTEKTHTPVALRVLPRLAHALAVGPKGLDTELAWITGKNRKAMQKGYLGDFLGTASRKIGLDRSAHGLRKTAARRYIEAGARPEQLKAIFGWTTSAMVDKYTKMFNREKVSLRAMDDFVLDAAFAPTLVLGGGKGSKKTTSSKA
jgi:Phage integrase family